MDIEKLIVGTLLIAVCLFLIYVVFRVLAALTRPVIRNLRRDLRHPSHFLYLLLFGFGAWNSANLVFSSVTSVIGEEALRVFVSFALLVFFSSNLLHQYLIYRSCVGAEIDGSEHTVDYVGWWVGRRLEQCLRLVMLILLLIVSGEFIFDGHDLTVTAGANALLFGVFLIWNMAALSRLPSATFRVPNPEARRSELRLRLKDAAWLNFIASALWVAVVLPNTIATILVVLTAFTYALLLVQTHIVKSRAWHRAYLVILGAALLVYTHWSLFNGPEVYASIRQVVH